MIVWCGFLGIFDFKCYFDWLKFIQSLMIIVSMLKIFCNILDCRLDVIVILIMVLMVMSGVQFLRIF